MRYAVINFRDGLRWPAFLTIRFGRRTNACRTWIPAIKIRFVDFSAD